MPVILIEPDEQRAWLDADTDSFQLQRPLVNELLETREGT
jgi:putative SOS response-associated peptidase YedK